MKDLKLVLGVVVGSAMLVFLMIFGLSKMSTGGSGGTVVDQNEILQGALLTKGSTESAVTVVNFSDVQCPACKVADEKLAELRQMNGVKMVFRHFPLQIHKNSVFGARAVEASRQLGKGWEMIDLLFSKQDEWSGEADPKNKFVEYAKSLGIKESDFIAAYESQETAAVVSADLALGDRLKLSGTPSIFVNGELVATQFVVGKVKDLLSGKK